MYKHGDAKDFNQARLYNIWQNMKQRCYGHKHNSYLYKGINVCDEWRSSYEAFKSWALSNGYEKTLSIDRIDGTKDYCPSNCRWASCLQQQNNIKKNFLVKINGERMSISAASRKIKMKPADLRYRILKLGFKKGDEPELDLFLSSWK